MKKSEKFYSSIFYKTLKNHFQPQFPQVKQHRTYPETNHLSQFSAFALMLLHIKIWKVLHSQFITKPNFVLTLDPVWSNPQGHPKKRWFHNIRCALDKLWLYTTLAVDCVKWRNAIKPTRYAREKKGIKLNSKCCNSIQKIKKIQCITFW